MTNREKLMQQIADMSNEDLADKLCQLHGCGTCPANNLCTDDALGFEVWLREEADND